MKESGTLVLGVCVAAFTATRRLGGASTGSWYIAPSINALWLDDGREADDDVGITLPWAAPSTENWDVELGLRFRTRRAGDDSLELQGFRCPPSACSIAKAG
jgi:hypothetical protein